MTVETLQQTQILSEFLASAGQFVKTVRELPERMLDCSEARGEWTVREIVHHMADDADVWCFVLKKAIANPGAPVRFEGFPGNERWFAALGFSHRPVSTALDLILIHRQMMSELAQEALEIWDDTSVQLFDEKGANIGEFGVAQILQMLTEHAVEHLRTIEKIRDK